jgi:hypothetical protein
MAFNYNNLTLSELINKIDTSRFFNLPKMVAEAFRKIPQPEAPKYKVYTALLSQSGTDAPVATVLENTLGGDVVWSRDTSIQYFGTLTGAFVNNTFVTISNTVYGEEVDGTLPVIYKFDNDTIGINPTNDDILTEASVEIRVYN